MSLPQTKKREYKTLPLSSPRRECEFKQNEVCNQAFMNIYEKNYIFIKNLKCTPRKKGAVCENIYISTKVYRIPQKFKKQGETPQN